MPPRRTTLPAPRRDGTYRVALVCLGNICRSPMAQVVLESSLAEAGLDDRVEVVSAGTSDWHVGKPMDRRAAATLTAAGYDASRHRAQQFGPPWLDEHDVILAMDSENLADLRAVAEGPVDRPGDGDGDGGVDGGGAADRIMLFRAFDPRAEADLDVPDPYYGGDDGFEHVLGIVTRTSRSLVDQLRAVVER